jgi:hypothetical protein
MLYRSLALSLVAFAGLIPAAQSAPMAFQAQDFLNVPGVYLMSTIAPLPDLSTGGRVALTDYILPLVNGSPGTYPPILTPIDSNFTFNIRLLNSDKMTAPDPTKPLLGYALLTISGQATGSIYGPTGNPPRNGGSFSSDNISVQVNDQWGPLPQQLLDLASHPERIHINGTNDWQYGRAVIHVSLTIDPPPPAPVPEPTAAAPWLVGLAVLALRHRARTVRGPSVS